jgi:fluoride exporter
MNPILFLAIAAGGFVGAPSRYLLDRAVNRRTDSELPWGTFLINLTGSFLLGLLTGMVLTHHLGSVPNALVGTGFCGAYTTFSTFTYETLRLVEEGELRLAALNVAASVVIGLAAATAGVAVGLAA